MSRTAFRTTIDANPANAAYRALYADWLEEQRDPEYALQRWLGITGRTPLYMPGNYFGWFQEGTSTLVHNSLPKELFKHLEGHDSSRKFMYFHADSGDDADRMLAIAWSTATTGVRQSRWLRALFNNRAPWVPGYTPVAESPILIPNNLNLIVQDQRSDGYSEWEDIEITTIDTHIRTLTNTPSTGRLFIVCQLHNYHIPILDCDGTTANAEAFLNLNDIGYAHFKSSQDKSWLIIDAASSSFEYASGAFRHVLDNDIKYQRICDQRKRWTLRAEIRNGYLPNCIHNSVRSELVRRFVELLEKHWRDGRVLEMARLRG